MVRRVLSAALAVVALFGLASADAPTCGDGSKCPQDSPCCSAYNQCGVGAFCLGGCDPKYSHSLDSCYHAPTCKSGDFKLTTLDDVQTIDKFLGDASSINWVSQGTPVVYKDSLLLTMAEGTVGTLLSSTHYVWYGKICAKMTSSQGKGVVTAFIMMSDVKDEIDFEFIGVDTADVQSNFYSQGVTVYTNSANLTVGNTVENVHEYCIDWQEDNLSWSIDGDEKRSLKRSDTWNSTSKRFDYPQTPSRIMLSLWPAGLPTNAKGTVDWAGGEIDWNSEYMQNGYYYAMVQEVTVKCYDPPPMAIMQGSKAYEYTDIAATNNTVKISDDLIILGSLYASGEDPELGATTASSAPKPTKSVDTVPGGNPGGGNRNEDISSSAPANNGGGAATSTGAAEGPFPTSGNGDPGNNNGGGGGGGFQQGPSGQGNGVSSLEPGLGKISGSALAIVVAVLGLLVL